MTASEKRAPLITGARGIILLLCLCALFACVFFECFFAYLGLSLLSASLRAPLVSVLCWSLWPFAASSLIYLKWPVVTLVVGWLFLLLSTYVAFRYLHEERDLMWFFYQHSLELGYIAASHIGYFVALRNRRRDFQMQAQSLAT